METKNPLSRTEQYLAAIAGGGNPVPDHPLTRIEEYLAAILAGGGGGGTVDFSIVTKVFPTVADMIADTTLEAGDNIATRAYYAEGDNGGANYVVSDSHTGIFYLTLNNGLYANRLDESGLLKAESIGIKAHAASVADPDDDEMSNNVLLFNTAVYNGIYLLFGKGYYYFNDAIQLAHKSTYTIRGMAREVTHFIFPESDGLYFSDPIYYNYYVITGLHIHSYGHTIRCAEDCLTVLDSHFEWLTLESETGDCFHAPDYNVAKYVDQGGTTVYDTCVQNCVFNFINASAPTSAAFCNIMGMYSYYQHMNLVSCKYGFKNCDGHVEQVNTLGTQEDYFIYYDKCNTYSLRWKFINVNAEGLAKAFIYSEPRKAAGAGEDPQKPETACICAISEFTAINSGWSLHNVESGHDIYPITIQEIQKIDLIDSNSIITPSQYPSVYDTSAVKGVIRITVGGGITRYNGGSSIVAVVTASATVVRYLGTKNRTLLTPSIAKDETNTRYPECEEAISADRFYGGRSRQVYTLTHSTDSVIIMNDATIPYEYALYDTITVKLTSTSSATRVGLGSCSLRYQDYGKIITIRNATTSTKDLVLKHEYMSANGVFSFADGQDVVLSPGDVAHFIITLQEISGTKRTILKPLAFS